MQVQDIINALENYAPSYLAEDFDNVGLIVGDKNAEVTGILVTLDTTEEVVKEAIKKKCNLIISFHPIIFSGLKSLTGRDYVEKSVMTAIKNDINIFAIHTNLDNVFEGVNYEIANRLGLKNQKILIPKNKTLLKLAVYVPEKDVDKIQTALFLAGAGEIGNYSECSFLIEGRGTFKPNEQSNPVIGEKEVRFEGNEIQLNVIFEKYKKNKILQTLFQVHPYEEVAYEIYEIINENQDIGMGRVGELEVAISEAELFKKIKNAFNVSVIRHSSLLHKKIKKIALLGGSGAFGISSAIGSGADVYISADFKYHDFFKADGQILLCDIGHYESEQWTKNILFHYLSNIFHSFAIQISETNTNPVNYS